MQNLIYKLKVNLKKILLKLLKIVPVKNGTVFVEVNWGNGYGDSPKYICDELYKQYPKCNVYWAIKDKSMKNSFPDFVKPVKRNSFFYFYVMATSKIILSNVRLAESFKKRKEQFYIQTWHGFGIKKIEKDAEKNLSVEYVRKAKNDSKNINLIISNSKTATKIYKEAFWYNGEVLEVGFPRNDMLLDCKKQKNILKKIKTKYPLIYEKKIVLYAPTFRNNHNLSCYDLDVESLINQLEKRFDEEFVCLLRLHPNIAKYSNKINCDKSIDVSEYDDMQELLAVSDILITDYSSSITDFLVTSKPCFIYARDIDEYKKDRDFYFELNTLTGTVSESNEELKSTIKNFDLEKFKANRTKFISTHGLIITTESTNKVVDVILENFKE